MFDGVKVFSVTKARDREHVGEDITRWLRDHPDYEIVEKLVRHSSDREFHCLSFVFFYRDRR